jgi:hypothetical protein
MITQRLSNNGHISNEHRLPFIQERNGVNVAVTLPQAELFV